MTSSGRIVIAVDFAVDLHRPGGICNSTATVHTAGNALQKFCILCLKHHIPVKTIHLLLLPLAGGAGIGTDCVVIMGVVQLAGTLRTVDHQFAVGRGLVKRQIHRAVHPVVGAEQHFRIVRRIESNIRAAAADAVDFLGFSPRHPHRIIHRMDQLKTAVILHIVSAAVIRAGFREEFTHGAPDIDDFTQNSTVYDFFDPL